MITPVLACERVVHVSSPKWLRSCGGSHIPQFQFLGREKNYFQHGHKIFIHCNSHQWRPPALKYFLNQCSIKKPSKETLLCLAELVLILNCFSFGDNYYKQVNGVAMGTKIGPSYANLFVGFIENKGSIVTRSITLQKYACYVIITRRKPLLFSILRSPMLRFSAHFLDNLEYKTLPYRHGQNRISAKQNIKKHCLFCNLINFSAMKNRTRQTDEWSVICTRPTLLTLAWASGRAVMSNPDIPKNIYPKILCEYLYHTFAYAASVGSICNVDTHEECRLSWLDTKPFCSIVTSTLSGCSSTISSYPKLSTQRIKEKTSKSTLRTTFSI